MQVAARTAELVAQVEAEGRRRHRGCLRIASPGSAGPGHGGAAAVRRRTDRRGRPGGADARLLPTRQGWVAGYNAQAAVVATPRPWPTARGALSWRWTWRGGLRGTVLPVRGGGGALGRRRALLAVAASRGPDLVGCAAAVGGGVPGPGPPPVPAGQSPTSRRSLTCPRGAVRRRAFPAAGRGARYVWLPRVCRTCPLFGTCHGYRLAGLESVRGQALRAHAAGGDGWRGAATRRRR